MAQTLVLDNPKSPRAQTHGTVYNICRDTTLRLQQKGEAKDDIDKQHTRNISCLPPKARHELFDRTGHSHMSHAHAGQRQ